jgi:hypothetical protein
LFHLPEEKEENEYYGLILNTCHVSDAHHGDLSLRFIFQR